MKGRSCGLFLCLFLGIACFSGYQVLRILHEYRVGADAYFKLEQFASLPPASEETEETPAELAWPEVDFTALAAVNPDVTAWLYGPDTGISYPVVQGTDNDYYLDHLLDGTANSAGCLFVDTSCRPDFSGRNTVIYGHRMKNGTMFAALGNYQEQVYYDAHPVFCW
ncbi:MAG: class B sortase [Oscillibacter sp.]|uniref:class B sortase n=1 Tax=Oscillibacter sp. TaxID=1945593 RepID=UPI00132C6AF4|nr:class B sortase [Oscillibacter sp.]MUU12894.1 class B sortase [Oscillibacter sp.]